MSLKEYQIPGVAFERLDVASRYLEEHNAVYQKRFVKGHIRRNPDESIDADNLKQFADKKALAFLLDHALDLYSSNENGSVNYAAGDTVINAMHDRIRHHIGRIAAVMSGYDPDDFRVKSIDWENPYLYAPYSVDDSRGERLVGVSLFLHNQRVDSEISCTYQFSRSFPTDEVPTIGIRGITYHSNYEIDA